MAIFVINEWLWSDLSGDNGQNTQRETLVIIEKLPASDHQIIIIEGSRFDDKAWRLCRNDNPMVVQAIGGLFVTNVRSDSKRCISLKSGQVVGLSDELIALVNPDDHYLVRAQLSVPGAILVTTDNTLREIVTQAGLKAISREDFLQSYF